MTLDKRIVWRKPDGSFLVTTLCDSGQRKGEVDEDYILRTISSLRLTDEYFVIDKSEFTQLLSGIPDADKRKVRCGSDGKLYYDATIKTQRQSDLEKAISIKTKLNSIGFSDDEIKLIARV